MPSDWTWDETLFAGAAAHYDRGRLPYAPGLSEALREALSLHGTGRLLDVGCGPGTITLRFAGLFESVVGMDADAGMLAEAKRLAAERGIANASWVHGLAETLPAGLGTFRVITFAQSFHWMERDRVASAARGMLEPGGVVVHVDNRHHEGVDPGTDADHPAPPTEAIDRLRLRYLGPDRRAGQSIRNVSPGNEAAVFRAAGFNGPEVVAVPDGRLLTRSTDDIVHGVFSNSSTAPHLFGERLAAFEVDLRAILAASSPDSLFSVQLPDNQLIIWRSAN